MKIDLSTFNSYLDRKLVSAQRHPSADLWIYNYTHKCQHEGVWDKVTTMCRGLIVAGDGTVVARPFRKFFNLEEHQSPSLPDVPTGVPFTAYDKMDGSLGIMYPLGGKVYIATRGSFVSDQAVEANKILEKYLNSKYIRDELISSSTEYTWLFEIIYPENRIVVDYHGERDLVLLALVEIETGKIIPAHEVVRTTPFKIPREIEDVQKPRDNSEGCVLYFDSGFMVKVKYEEYVRLHRLVTGVTKRRIWDLLRTGVGTKELLDRVPEEFEQWVKDATLELMGYFTDLCLKVRRVVNDAQELFSRKDQAQFIFKYLSRGEAGVAFAMLDGKDYEAIAWKLIKPSAEKPFREDM